MDNKLNFIFRLKRKYNYLRTKKYIKRQSRLLFQTICENTVDKTIYYFCVPSHSNLGDQAQLFCWLRLFSEWYPEYNIIQIPCRMLTDASFLEIRKRIKLKDKIFIHSGYLIFDPHSELPVIRKVVDNFHDHEIVILPQTININDSHVVELTTKCFNSHPLLTIISRDEVSKANADRLFPKCKRLLMPDVVTSLIGDSHFTYPDLKRNGIMFCVRNDGEKFYSDEEIQSLRRRFDNVRTDMSDTTIKANVWEWQNNREMLIREILKKMSEYQVIITDRYHGTIFSQIVNTPVIVINSTDHKLSSGVNWFPVDKFGENVCFAHTLEDAYEKAIKILSRNGKIIHNPTWFKDTYYNHNICVF